MAVLFAATIFLTTCTKEQSDVRFNAKLSTSQYLDIKSDSATVVGFVVASGSGFTEKGVCYDTVTAPTTEKSKVVYTGESKTATFNVILSGLLYTTKYYARAYAFYAGGTIYGEEVSFTTLPALPILTTSEMSKIGGTSATGGGNVTNNGGADVTARGICYGKSHNPTISDSKTNNGKGTGEFVSTIISLEGVTTYYVRAYATNSAGTGYGPEVTFTTLVSKPVVTTIAVTGITQVFAVSGGEVTKDGGDGNTVRGIVWSTTSNPTITSNVVTDGGTGKGSFISNISGLTAFTTYHVRAFATNSAGTVYGKDILFITLAK